MMPSKFEDFFTSEAKPAQVLASGVSASLSDQLVEIPVSLEVFIRDKRYLGMRDFIPSPIQEGLIKQIERVYAVDMYPKLAEYDPYWAQYIRPTNYHVAQYGKGCIMPHTPVYDASDGLWKVVSEAPAMTVQGVESINADGTTSHNHGERVLSDRVRHAQSSEPFKRGHGRCVRVTTCLGLVTDVYEGHLYLSQDSRGSVWKSAGSLSIGDSIGVARKLECLNPVPVLSFEESKISRTGAWVSGSLWKARVPEFVFSLPDDQLRLFISSAWNIGGVLLINGESRPELKYNAMSEEIAHDMQRLLFRLGVVSSLVRADCPFVYISDPASVQFLLSQMSLSGNKEIIRKKLLSRMGEGEIPATQIYWDSVVSIEDLGDGDYWDMNVPNLGSYVAGSGPVISSNSGKDACARLALLRIAYLLLCLKSPQSYFGMSEDDSIHMLNVAKSAQQAQKAFFDPLKKNVTRGWFADKANPTKYEIEFDKGVMGISGHSDTDSQEGLNLILGICDEIDGFRTRDETVSARGATVRDSSKSAESIMNMMRSSGITRFPEVFKQVYISYPYYLGSTIQKLTDEGKADNEEYGSGSNWFVSGPYATWEVKPSAKKEHFDKEYKRDPHEAAGKYECKPSFAMDPYFRNSKAVLECMTEETSHAVDVSYVTDGKAWKPMYEFSPDFYPVQGAQYSVHADLAIRNDRAGIAMAHVVRSESVEKEIFGERGDMILVTEQVPVVKVDFVITFEADLTCQPAREIQIKWARDLWADLKLRGFNIRQFTMDGFQSAQTRQEFESLGILSPLLSTDRSEEPWKTLRDMMYGGRVSIPYSDLLRNELLALTKKTNGKVDHTANSSKDAADALACAVTGAIMLGGQEDPSGARAFYDRPQFEVSAFSDIPEMQMLELDPMNMESGGYEFDAPLDTYTWSAQTNIIF